MLKMFIEKEYFLQASQTVWQSVSFYNEYASYFSCIWIPLQYGMQLSYDVEVNLIECFPLHLVVFVWYI